MKAAPVLSYAVPHEAAIAAEIAATGLGRMQAIARLRQREALRRAGFHNKGGL